MGAVATAAADNFSPCPDLAACEFRSAAHGLRRPRCGSRRCRLSAQVRRRSGRCRPPTARRHRPPLPAPSGGAAQLDKVEITGGRADDVQERRQSTAAKIIIGREEIERFGDSTLGDVLKRLPGVTIQGRPGRGGAIRLRGLGSGYTQILLDGERVPAGFSLDSFAPEQIERIEILRAPTAETGARAIAGTINIVTRGGYTKRINDVRIGTGIENDRLQPCGLVDAQRHARPLHLQLLAVGVPPEPRQRQHDDDGRSRSGRAAP